MSNNAQQDMVMLEIQRALGRVESRQQTGHDEFLREFKALKDELIAHKAADATSFGIIEAALSGLRTTSASLTTQDRNTRLIGKWIISTLGTLVFLVGSAVIAFLTNHIKIQ